MEPTYNYYWDPSDPAKPFKHKLLCNYFSLIPENATRVPPPESKPGLIPCWDGEKWFMKVDWRQKELYSKSTGKQAQYPTVDVDHKLLEEDYTSIPRTTPFDVWKDGKWVTDNNAKQKYDDELFDKKRKDFIALAGSEITMIDDIVFFKQETNAEDLKEYENLLKQWRFYRGKLLSMNFLIKDEPFPEQPPRLEKFKH